MYRCRMSSGSVTTRGAPVRYSRIHLVGRRPFKAVGRGSGCLPVTGEQLAFEPRQRLGAANQDAARQARSACPARRCAS